MDLTIQQIDNILKTCNPYFYERYITFRIINDDDRAIMKALYPRNEAIEKLPDKLHFGINRIYNTKRKWLKEIQKDLRKIERQHDSLKDLLELIFM